MRAFSGFPDGELPSTPLPDAFFVDVLPGIADILELKVTLHVLWLTHRAHAAPVVSLSQLLHHGALSQALQASAQPAEQALSAALQNAVMRGTLLQLTTASDGSEQYYAINTAQGRQLVQQAQSGRLALTEEVLAAYTAPAPRPNIFVLYEQNIGLLQPLIAQDLEDAEEMFPAEWIEEAFRIAVENNVRNWKYVRRILERWATEGKDSKGKARGKTWYTDEERKRFRR